LKIFELLNEQLFLESKLNNNTRCFGHYGLSDKNYGFVVDVLMGLDEKIYEHLMIPNSYPISTMNINYSSICFIIDNIQIVFGELGFNHKDNIKETINQIKLHV